MSKIIILILCISYIQIFSSEFLLLSVWWNFLIMSLHVKIVEHENMSSKLKAWCYIFNRLLYFAQINTVFMLCNHQYALWFQMALAKWRFLKYGYFILKCVYFPHTVRAFFHTLGASIFLYCRYRSIITKIISLHCT